MATATTRSSIVDTLRSVVAGRVLTAGDPDYDRSRTPYFEHRIGNPLAVVRPRDVRDVSATVDIARCVGAELAVRGGGHSSHSTGDGLLLDLGDLRGIDVVLPTRTAWVGAGLTAREVSSTLSGHGLTVGFGDTGSVGIAGVTLGGGVGYLSRRDGLTVDNLVAAEIVTADGRVRLTDAEREPELFWALRGGGGNVGVVTRFRFRLTTTSTVHAGMLVLPALPEVIAELISTLARAGDALTAIVDVMRTPPLPGVPESVHGRLVTMVRVCHAGDPARAEQALAPLRRIAPAPADLVRPMQYADLLAAEAPSRGSRVAVRTQFVDHVDVAAARLALDHLERPGPPMRSVQFRVLGGAIDRVPTGATAYAHRGAPIMVNAVHDGREDRAAALRWTDSVAAALDQGRPGAYVNFLGPEQSDQVEAAYPGPTLARLRGVKTTYDPHNLFHGNVNVRPWSAS